MSWNTEFLSNQAGGSDFPHPLRPDLEEAGVGSNGPPDYHCTGEDSIK